MKLEEVAEKRKSYFPEKPTKPPSGLVPEPPPTDFVKQRSKRIDMKKYKTTLTQYIAPEHGDDEKRYYAQREIDLPFIPTKDAGLKHPDLGEYVWFIQTLHYDIGENKIYITINSRWFQIWDGNRYDYTETLKEMEAYVEYLRNHGWTVTESKYND